MFDSLEKYEEKDHFFFTPTNNLREVCNAPTDKSGVYLIYALKDGRIELVYVGCSGKLKKDGQLFIRKSGLGGVKDRLVNGKQFGAPRRISWKSKMISEGIETLDVYWYVTQDNENVDCPKEVESQRFGAWRSGGLRSTKLSKHHKT